MVMAAHETLQMQEPSVHQTEFVNCFQDVTKVSVCSGNMLRNSDS